MVKNKMSRAQTLELHSDAKWNIQLTPTQLDEFNNLSYGIGSYINDNRLKVGELPLYHTSDVIPTLADLEFVRTI